ncbi:hypothetical protein BXQ17_11235 [Polaribacter sp. BM10]|uniref:hypothetical protein n=1 Tax=Polaribacter sp. BM10 TaxID=1529069 RepID=UPI00098B3A86|nr:hypothetical protein [Polaribacter sp. BM10]AQS94607.1 hypothetical protein BXQ17_11235 [Polaribacter sp. BM10]
MKKILLLISITLLSSCLNSDDLPNYRYEFLKIDEATTPNSFTFGEKDTIKIKYTLLNSCYNFDNIYYEYQDSTRIVAVRSYVNLDNDCQEVTTQKEYDIIVNVAQEEDYIFKFYKGVDIDGESIFEEVIIPVN